MYYMVIFANDDCLMFKIEGDSNTVINTLKRYFILKELSLVDENINIFFKIYGFQVHHIDNSELNEVLLLKNYKVIDLSNINKYIKSHIH